MVGTRSEHVTCMEVDQKEETVEGAQAPVVAAIPAIPAGGARKVRTVAGVKIKAESSEMILQWISKMSLEI